MASSGQSTWLHVTCLLRNSMAFSLDDPVTQMLVATEYWLRYHKKVTPLVSLRKPSTRSSMLSKAFKGIESIKKAFESFSYWLCLSGMENNLHFLLETRKGHAWITQSLVKISFQCRWVTMLENIKIHFLRISNAPIQAILVDLVTYWIGNWRCA